MSADDPRVEKALDNAGRGVQPIHPSWNKLPERLAATPQAPPRRWRRWLWLAPVPVAAAAAVVLALTFGGGTNGPISPGPARGGELPPVEVKRQDVDLTILSVAETEGETLYMPIIEMLGRRLMQPPGAVQAVAQEAVWMGKRKGDYRYRPQPALKRTGQALVKDHRLVLNLREGENVVRFADVAATIDPTSVRFRSDTDPDGTLVAEQDFEYDLAFADALLKRYIDRAVTCVFKDRHETAGYLASFDDHSLVLTAGPPPAPGDPGKANPAARTTQAIARGELQAVRLKEVPSGLLVKPTLVWKLRAKKAGRHDVTVSYLCGFIKWEADYVALVTPGEGGKPTAST